MLNAKTSAITTQNIRRMHSRTGNVDFCTGHTLTLIELLFRRRLSQQSITLFHQLNLMPHGIKSAQGIFRRISSCTQVR